jgi:hypothetical protein
MEDSYLTKKSGLNKLDNVDKAEHQLFVRHFNKVEEKVNSYRLLFGGETLTKPYK